MLDISLSLPSLLRDQGKNSSEKSGEQTKMRMCEKEQ